MSKLQASASLKEQIGSRGFFGVVTISAELRASGSSRLTIQFAEDIDDGWRAALAVGLRMGWRCLPSKHNHCKHVVVTVDSIDTNPVDTSESIMLYVAAKALLGLFDADPPNSPAFVREFGIFVFGN